MHSMYTCYYKQTLSRQGEKKEGGSGGREGGGRGEEGGGRREGGGGYEVHVL